MARKITPPAVNPETKPFWDAARAGRFWSRLRRLRQGALVSARHLSILRG